MTDLSIIIVSWNVRDLLRNCLLSIRNSPGFQIARAANPAAAPQAAVYPQSKTTPSPAVLNKPPWNMEVIVVDNASTDGSPALVRQEFPWVQLLSNQSNLGFPAANNQGINCSSGRYLLLLNPDTEVVGDALSAMLSYMESHPDVGVLGPQLRYSDGSLQSSRRRFPTLATAFVESTILQGFFAHSRLLQRYYMLDTPDDAVQDVDWVVGAAMLVRRQVVDQVGGLDEGFFMYSEELDWCRRIKGAGWRVVYFPKACIVHHEGKSSEQALAIRHISFHSSKVRYFRKHHGVWQARILRLFLLVTYVWQLVEEGAKWLLGHKRPLRAQRVRTYWQVLRSGLKARAR